jgi:hypothetical protein
MKKIIATLFIACSCWTNIQAQDVYYSIRNKAKESVESPETPMLMKKLNQFKIDALDYMVMKMREQMPDSSATYLDKQAYALNNFLLLYMRSVIDSQKLPKVQQVDIIKLFMDATYSNPLFNDQDKELVLAYFSDGSSFTRFSLDTNWQLAFIAVATEMKKRESK